MRIISILLIMISFFSVVNAQSSKTYDLLIGTYSNEDNSNGIQVYLFNSENGDFTFRAKASDVINPSYLAVSRDRKNLYAVSEQVNGKGSIGAFSFDPASGTLTFMNSVTSGGDGPCYISVDDKKKYVFVANYNGGSLSAVRLNKDGSLSADIQTIEHEGSSLNKSRQEKPHVHSVVLSPDDRFLFTPDLGTDKVNIYRYDPSEAEPLSASDPAFAGVKEGSGPRHFMFHPNKKFAYLIHEMEGMITAFNYKKGKVEPIQSITMLAADFNGNIGAADIHISPDGRFLYASNRGDANNIVIYNIAENGKLTFAGRQSTLGKTPRNFAIDPDGNFLLVANKDSNDIIIFKRNKESGWLMDTGKKIEVDKPVCLKFAKMK